MALMQLPMYAASSATPTFLNSYLYVRAYLYLNIGVGNQQFFAESWQTLRRPAGPPLPAGGMSGCFAPSQALPSTGGCATSQALARWRVAEDPRPSWNMVATVSSRGTQARDEEGAGAQGSRGEVEGSPCAQGAAFLLVKHHGRWE